MNKLNDISKKYNDLPYMTHEQALYMRDLILKYKCKSLCELGTFHGKSSVYIGSILEEQGLGHLYTFDVKKRTPAIFDLLKEFDLENFVTPIISEEGYTWDLSDIIQKQERKFDFCYIDGGHTFESTALAFILTDILLEPGGIIVFDDVYWTVEKSIKKYGSKILSIYTYRTSTPKQKIIPQVKMVCDVIIPNYRYTLIEELERFNWRVYQKIS
jgi:predicted O-methyltransferase YrrM